MVASDGRGYLLPPGEAFTDEYECCLVFVPAKDEYRRAFFGALDYFGTWLAWERDAGKRGKDAAAAWKLANEFTRECWEMAACDLMVENLVAIRRLLEQQHCCDDGPTITYNENTIITTTIVPDQGDSPTTWGESETPADWDDWKEYVCYHAHLYVDDLITYASDMDTIVGVGSWGIDFLAFILSKLIYRTPSTITVPVKFGWVNGIALGLLNAIDDLEFDTLPAKFEAGREDIVCALINGTSLEDAVEATVDNTTLWTLFYSWFNYETTTAAIYTGEVEGYGYLVPSQRDDCTCEIVRDYYYVEDFSPSLPSAIWNDGTSSVEWSAAYGGNAYFNNGLDHYDLPKAPLAAHLGVSDRSFNVHRILFRWRASVPANSTPRIDITFDDGEWYFNWPGADSSGSTVYEKEFFFDPPKLWNAGAGFRVDGAATDNYLSLVDFEIDMDDV